MGFWNRALGSVGIMSNGPASQPRASYQSAGGGTLIVTPQDLEEALRTGHMSASGEAVTPATAMRVAAVFGCVRVRCTGPATLPIDIKKRVDARTRQDASDHWAWELLRRKPNRWMKPHQFKRMLQAQVMLRGNGYALKVPGVGGRIQALLPMDPDRVHTQQLDDQTIVHDWTRRDGRKIRLQQDQVFHLFGLTLDGVRGVTPLTYARESIGNTLAMDRYQAKVLEKGARVSGVLEKKEGGLSDKAYDRLKESVEEFRAGGEREGDFLILEEGLSWKAMSLTLADMQWIESQKHSRSNIMMFYGVPPFLLGDTEKSTSWGSGIEQQKQGFLDFTAEDDLTMWEEGINADVIGPGDIFARFNRAAYVRGDIKTRNAAYTAGRNGGWYSKNDIRGFEDMNPIEGGDDYDAPLNSNAVSGNDSNQRDPADGNQ